MSEQVQAMFSGIARRYDLLNSVLSLGIHHLWRRACVRFAGAAEGEQVIDCASGTGDLAFALEAAVGPQGAVTGTDFCQPMLDRAIEKGRRRQSRVRFFQADAMHLPEGDDRYDLATIAFGIRNVDDPGRCLAELARVVRPGGRVVVLEFGQPTLPGLAQFYRWYSRVVMPRLGAWLSGDRSAYTYLPETAAAFPAGERFLDLMRSSGGYSRVSGRPLSFGIAWLYRGEVA